MYYQMRAAHHGVVTSDWLAQAQSAVGGQPEDSVSENYVSSGDEEGKGFMVDEFNNWRKQPELAEIRALASVIRSSQATTMMELEIELKKASESLKLILVGLYQLEEIPLGIGDINTLNYIELRGCSNSAIDSAQSILNEQAEYGNFHLKVRSTSTGGVVDMWICMLKMRMRLEMKEKDENGDKDGDKYDYKDEDVGENDDEE